MALCIWQTALLSSILEHTALINGWFMMIIFIIAILYFICQYQLNFIQQVLVDSELHQAIKCSHLPFPQPCVLVYEPFNHISVNMKCDMTHTLLQLIHVGLLHGANHQKMKVCNLFVSLTALDSCNVPTFKLGNTPIFSTFIFVQ